MSIKAIIIAAATIASTASIASAASYFELPRAQEATNVFNLGLVRAEADGVVEIYDIVAGIEGEAIGTQDVRAGANTDVRINTDVPVRRDVIAVLKVDGEIVASETFDITR